MGLAEIRAIKKMDGMYTGETATAKVIAGLQPKVKKPIAKQSQKAKDKLKEEKETFLADKQFYAEVWLASPHKCEVCKAGLPKEPLTTFFHHILKKSVYPAFRHEPANILVVCPDCHNQIETDINKVPYAKKRLAQVTKELLG